ncbi:MAG: hypothetical protein ACRD96_26970 [Bryobacteraceae bacterium]
MKKVVLIWAVLLVVAMVIPVWTQQTFTGRLSDSTCRESHRSKAGSESVTDRQCLLACINALSKYVLVAQGSQVIAIANQDAMGLPLYAGRPVKLTGELKGGSVFVSRVEAIAAHLHLGHVMTNWRDTPGSRGFLPVAADEATVAFQHARLASQSASLDDVKLHAGHVLHALDPTLESKGPGAGYGVTQAATGAAQHLDFAVRAEGVTADITTYAARVSSSLARVQQWIGEAVAAAKKIRAATNLAEAAQLSTDLVTLTRRISEDGLQPAHTDMDLLLKAEGLAGAPR